MPSYTNASLRSICADKLLVNADCAGAKLPEPSGRLFSLCVDVLRWGCCALGLNLGLGLKTALNQQLGRQCSLDDVQRLREHGREGMDALIRMNASAYTYFHTDCSGVAGSGVYNWLEGVAVENSGDDGGSWVAARRRLSTAAARRCCRGGPSRRDGTRSYESCPRCSSRYAS